MKAISYSGWLFTYPAPLFLTPAPSGPGLYAIQVADKTYRPHPFEPICFGESDDLADRAFPTREAFRRWCLHPAVRGGSLLYISYMKLAYNRRFRLRVTNNLIGRYRPACNAPVRELSGFLGD
ncbi:MAG TPA: hypothetical protein VMN79_02395 [Casimicrobiaceae bacterium]|nr:hypothetical protein [Casimicrobiaceae bacterium]